MVSLFNKVVRQNNVNILYQNVRGLKTKTITAFTNALKQQADVILLTETWLNDTVYDHEILDNRYSIFRRDRSSSDSYKSEGGGVLIAVLKSYMPVRKFKWESSGEDLWICIKLRNGNSTIHLCICTAYLPSPITHTQIAMFTSNFTNVVQHKMPRDSLLLLVGDFNLPSIKWNLDNSLNSLVPANTLNQTESLFTECIFLNCLHQINQIANAKDRILDLVITNSQNCFTVNSSTLPLVVEDSHHPALCIHMKLKTQKSPKINHMPTLNFNKADYPSIKAELDAIDWNDKLNPNLSVDQTLECFYNLISPIISKHTPMRNTRNMGYPFWFSRPLIKALKEKAKFHYKFKMYSNPRDKLSYQILRDRCKVMISECLNEFKSKAKAQLINNPNYFWSFVKSLRSNSSDIPDEMYHNTQTALGGLEISNLFSEYFHSVYQVPVQSVTTSVFEGSSNIHGSLGLITLPESDILKSLQQIDPQKGPGPDSIPPNFLKICSSQLSRPLHYIFNKSLSEGVFPKKWKEAHITPILKKGDQCDVKNYRPISILSSFGKLFELLVQERILHQLKTILNPHQHGFLPCKSTASNLVDYVDDIHEALEEQNEVHAIYTDFSKAFDVVDHSILLQKLDHAGICGSLLRWCESYLCNRSQLVKIRGYLSGAKTVTSGVPQGSHLGPLFFLVFINDLCAAMTSKYQLFADDLKLYKIINSPLDVQLLQRDIDAICSWCSVNKMSINTSKCFHLKFTRKKNPTPASYKINNVLINEVSNIRDLGVIVDTKLDFREHIDYITKKGARLTGFVLRQTKFFKDPEVCILLFNCFVRSLLEYCCPVWNPFYAVHIQRLERIQKQFLYHLSYANNLCRSLQSYDSRLTHYKISSLENRRCLADLVFLHKLVSGKIDSPDLLAKLNFKIPRTVSRLHNRVTFYVPLRRTKYGKHSPMLRMASAYNKVCSEIDMFGEGIRSFKNLVRK